MTCLKFGYGRVVDYSTAFWGVAPGVITSVLRVFSLYLGFYLRGGGGGGAAVSTGQGRLRLLKLVIDSSGRDR